MLTECYDEEYQFLEGMAFGKDHVAITHHDVNPLGATSNDLKASMMGFHSEDCVFQFRF